MLKTIEEFGKCYELCGFRNVTIGDSKDFLQTINRKLTSVIAQFFDASLIASAQHVHFALLNALTAFKNGENISRNLAVETILYASAKRQIQKATEMMGIKTGTSDIAVLLVGEKRGSVQSAAKVVSESLNCQRDDSVLELTDEKLEKIKRAFDISDAELQSIVEDDVKRAIIDLVIERMALLVTLI